MDSNPDIPLPHFELQTRDDKVVKITPIFYDIEENVVRERMMENSRSLPDKITESWNYSNKCLYMLDGFRKNPVFYLLLEKNTKVYGVTTKVLREECGMTPSAINNALDSIVNMIQKGYGDGDGIDKDALFPWTTVKVKRKETDQVHVKQIKNERIRVIPSYTLPFLVQTSAFSLQAKASEYIHDFLFRIYRFYTRYPSLAFYKDNYFQLRANIFRVFDDVRLTSNKLDSDLCVYNKAFVNLTKEVQKSKETCKVLCENFNRKINALEAENSGLKNRLNELEKICERKLKKHRGEI